MEIGPTSATEKPPLLAARKRISKSREPPVFEVGTDVLNPVVGKTVSCLPPMTVKMIIVVVLIVVN